VIAAARRARDQDRQNRPRSWRGRTAPAIAAGACLAASVLAPAAPLAAEQATPTGAAPGPALLSAYFGLDDALPLATNAICRGGAGQDGMPVVFAAEVDAASVQPEDFAVATASGAVRAPICATLQPAVDPGERRTVLLIGEFGDAADDPPARVEVVGDIRAAEGSGRDFRGASAGVTPLAAGPTLVLAEPVPPEQWRLGQPAGRQRGDGCPAEGTEQAVRATWAGGVTDAAGNDPDPAVRRLYEVTLRGPDGGERVVAPFAVADLGDGDNNHLLCLDAPGEPTSVSFPAGHLYDPNRDAANPDTRVAIDVTASD
jgi:hypothetical protein